MDPAGAAAELVGVDIAAAARVATSDWAEVWRAETADGRRLALKVARRGARRTAALEARMLTYLAEHSALPVPKVVATSDEDDLLVMTWLEGSDSLGGGVAQREAGRLIAELHNVTAPEYGLDFDTLYAPIDQPNAPSTSWVDFFGQRRLLHMTGIALARGRIGAGLGARLERLAAGLSDLIPDRPPASLLHGDLWQGNIIAGPGESGGAIAGFVDPAIYYGHAEMDLAFSTLFGTSSPEFFVAYGEIRPIEPGFFEERRNLYNLWPLLGHAALFGGGYAAQVERIVAGYGF